MNTFFERYKALLDFIEKFFSGIVTHPTTPLQIIGQIIIFFIIAIATLVVLAFSGLLQDPTGIFIPTS
jgi:hypothetical protein